MSDWADEEAEKLLTEMRGKPKRIVLTALACALRRAAGDAAKKLAVAESAIETLESLEPVESSFEGSWVESQYDGFCKDCGSPYAVGKLVWWLGPGRGAYCEGCQKASEWAKEKAVSGGRRQV